MTVRRVVAGALAAGCLVLAVGCGSSGDDSSTSEAKVARSADAQASVSSGRGDDDTGGDALAATDDVAGDVGPSSEVAAAGAPGAPGGQGAETQSGTDAVDAAPASVGRSIVSTAMVTVESDNVIEARQRSAAIVTSAGGAIFDEQTELGDRGRTTLTLRVPPDQFESVLAQLGQVGKLTTQDISTEDVTSQVVDLDARVAGAQASVDRMRLLMSQASTVMEIAALEDELASRETNLEVLKGQQRTLEGRVDLATIVLTVTPPPAVAPAPPPEEPSELPTFVEGLANGWEVVVTTLTVLAAAAGWVVPFVPFVIAFAVAVRWYRRHHRAASDAHGAHLPPPPQPAA